MDRQIILSQIYDAFYFRITRHPEYNNIRKLLWKNFFREGRLSYVYAVAAIELIVDRFRNGKRIVGIANAVSKEYGFIVTGNAIDRSIRAGLEKAFKRAQKEELFSRTDFEDPNHRPSAMRFLKTIARQVMELIEAAEMIKTEQQDG